MCVIDKNKYDALVAEAGGLQSDEAMSAFLHLLRDEFRLKHLHFTASGFKHSAALYNLTTYSDEWIDRYYANRAFKHDPIMRLSAEGRPFYWEHITPLNEMEAFVMKERLKWIGPRGFTIPLSSSDGSTSILTFVGRDDDDKWETRLSELYTEFNKLGMQLHATFLSNLGLTPPAIKLSTRHLDCIHMLASGMNEIQIAAILDCTEKSVKKYIGEIKLRLRARTKVQAVAAAISLGILNVS